MGDWTFSNPIWLGGKGSFSINILKQSVGVSIFSPSSNSRIYSGVIIIKVSVLFNLSSVSITIYSVVIISFLMELRRYLPKFEAI